MTIALRYAVIRRQFGGNANAQETKLLDYVIHQHRLMPLLAQAVINNFYTYQTFIVCHAFHWCGIG